MPSTTWKAYYIQWRLYFRVGMIEMFIQKLKTASWVIIPLPIRIKLSKTCIWIEKLYVMAITFPTDYFSTKFYDKFYEEICTISLRVFYESRMLSKCWSAIAVHQEQPYTELVRPRSLLKSSSKHQYCRFRKNFHIVSETVLKRSIPESTLPKTTVLVVARSFSKCHNANNDIYFKIIIIHIIITVDVIINIRIVCHYWHRGIFLCQYSKNWLGHSRFLNGHFVIVSTCWKVHRSELENGICIPFDDSWRRPRLFFGFSRWERIIADIKAFKILRSCQHATNQLY